MPQHSLNLLRSVSRVSQLGDAEMLRRFINNRDSAAFEVLVWRHGPAIFSACRRMLRDTHLAEDALQATFLLLSQKAATIREGEQLAGWLHRTACRVCWRAAKKKRPESLPDEVPAASVSTLEPDTAAILDAEVNRLPERFRIVVVLCYLESRSTDEAARMLGIPRGTVLSRLATARAKLMVRLTKQGLAPALGVTLLSGNLSADLVQRCVSIGCHTGLALSTVPFQLAQGVIAMSMQKLMLAWSLVLISVAGVGTGVAVVATAGDEPGTTHKPNIPDYPELPAAKSRETAFDKQVAESWKASDSLHGTWELIKIEINDRDLSHDKGFESMIGKKRTFNDFKVGIDGKTRRYVTSTFGEVSHLTYHSDDLLMLMIFHLDNDILKIGYSNRPAVYRPKSFSLKDLIDGETLTVMTYKRVEDEPEVEKKQPEASADDAVKPAEPVHEAELAKAQAEAKKYQTMLNDLRKKQLSPVLVDSKKAALIAVEQELVKAEVKLIPEQMRFDLLEKTKRLRVTSTSELIAYEGLKKAVSYLKEQRETLQQELINSMEINNEMDEIQRKYQHHQSLLKQLEESKTKTR